MFWFAAASLTPVLCLVAACLLGGPWPLLSVLSITVWVFLCDRLVTRLMPDTSPQDGRMLTFALVGAHVLLWVLGLWAIGAGTHLSLVDKLLIGTGLGLWFGQISNSNAHELIHKRDRLARRLGVAVYCSHLFGHHASAHTKVHHRFAATPEDPNSARLGEGFWRYLWRAAPGEFLAGKRAEDRLRAISMDARWHPYIGYVSGAGLALLIAFILAGVKGVSALVVIAAYAQVQLYLSDYVQHYGLQRMLDSDGKFEPIGMQHSWNAPHWYSSAMMLNAPRHSDHHTNPARDFPSLRMNTDTMPTLPHSLPVMAVIALVPPLWRRMMDWRVQYWRGMSQSRNEDWQSDAPQPTLAV